MTTNLRARIDYDKAEILILCRNPYEMNRLNSCAKEPDTVAWIEAMPEGAMLWDVGANVGTYSLIAAANGLHITAFEPGEASFGALAANIKLNSMEAPIAAIRCALGSRRASGRLEYSSREAGAAVHRLEYGGNEFEIYPMDEVCDTFGTLKPQYVKIDVDGGEVDVLMGARIAFAGVYSALIEVDKITDGPVSEIMNDYGFFERSRRVRSKKTHNVIFER